MKNFGLGKHAGLIQQELIMGLTGYLSHFVNLYLSAVYLMTLSVTRTI
jgi:hypothetical protein